MKFLIKFLTISLNFIYFFIKLFPTKDKILMISRQSNKPSIDFLLLKEAIKQKDKEVEIVFLCHTLDGGIKSSLKDKIKYGFHMLRQMYEIATSKIVVLDTYCIVISLLKHKKSLKVIQMWHSIGTMKKFGYTALDTSEGTRKSIALLMHMHENYSYILASSPAYKEDLAKGFNYDESKVEIFPLPRVDLLLDDNFKEKKKREILLKHPDLSGKTIILYCPTFRKNEEKMKQAVNDLCNELKSDQILILKLHPLSKLKIRNTKVKTINDFTSFEMLFIADALISDYSCIVYEAALLNIPLYFYNFDMQNYTGIRGLAIDYEIELPGVISKNAKTIVNAIKYEKYDMEQLKKFCNKYVIVNGNASNNLAEFILELMDRR